MRLTVTDVTAKAKEFQSFFFYMANHKHHLRLLSVDNNARVITFSCRELVCMVGFVMDLDFYRDVVTGKIQLYEDGRWDWL